MKHLGDYGENAEVRFLWNTFDTFGGSITRATSGTIKVRRLSDGTDATGTSVNDSENTPDTGIHEVKVDTTDNANFIIGDDYAVWIDGAVIDGQTVNAVLAEFSIQNRYQGAVSSGSAAINTVAESFTKAGAEPETNTYTATHQEDGTYHIVEDDATSTDAYYQFDIGGNGVPVSITWTGYAQSNGDSYALKAYNFVTTNWDQIGTKAGINPATPFTERYALTNQHVGTSGADLGKVRFKFESSDGTAYATDRVLCSYSVVAQSVGYADGAIWVDTNNGTAGTESYVNGTADNPVSTWGDALTIAGNLGLIRFHIINGSTIQLSADSSNYTLLGENWTLDLNDQIVTNASFAGASVSGACTGSGYEFRRCTLNTMSFEDGLFLQCAVAGELTMTAAGTYYFENCFSGIAGTATPDIDFGAIGDQNLNFRHYSGGIEIKQMGVNGTDNMSLEGHGQFIINANCTGGTIAVRGHFKKTDNADGAVTVSEDANFFSNVIHSGTAQGPGTGDNQIQLAGSASGTDGAYDPAEVFIIAGTGVGQTRLVLEYDGTTKTATVDRNWKVKPDATSGYRIMASAGREHINEGLAQGGTSSSITLNTMASSHDNVYVGQIVFIRSGTGEDQAALVTAYDGTTKVASIAPDWPDDAPDSTSAYVMLPTGATLRDITSGTGAQTETLTIDDGSDPIAGAFVWLTNDASGNNLIASGTTDDFGQVEFFLNTGTYYAWVKLSGYNFTNPTTVVVT